MAFTWQTLDADGPGPRSRHCLWYDPECRASILFGGLVWRPNGSADFPPDTWMLCDGDWRRVNCDTAPLPRHRGAAAYDKREGHAVLFGGQTRSHWLLGDTWLHKNGEWQRRRFWRGRDTVGRSMTRRCCCGSCVVRSTAIGRSDTPTRPGRRAIAGETSIKIEIHGQP